MHSDLSVPSIKADFAKYAITGKMIWGALSASQLMYGAVLMGSARSLRARSDVTASLDPLLFVIFAGTLAGISITLRTVLFSKSRLNAMIPSLAMETRDPEQISAVKGTLLQKCLVFNIINWALNEVIALVGFVLAFANRDPALFYPYLAAALALNLLMFPAEQRLFKKAGLE